MFSYWTTHRSMGHCAVHCWILPFIYSSATSRVSGYGLCPVTTTGWDGRKAKKRERGTGGGGGGRERRLLSIVPDSGRLTEWLQQRVIRIGVIE